MQVVAEGTVACPDPRQALPSGAWPVPVSSSPPAAISRSKADRSTIRSWIGEGLRFRIQHLAIAEFP